MSKLNKILDTFMYSVLMALVTFWLMGLFGITQIIVKIIESYI